jgi:tetratricopeptide (TPR) repeat protein
LTRSLGRIDNRPSPSFVAGSVFLVTAIFIAYLPALHGGPVWDDDYMLTANPVMSDPHALWRIFFDLSANKIYYPLTLATLWIESRFFGFANLTGYHVVNTLLHGFNAILLWRLLRRLDVRGAFAIAAIWGLHPTAVESVAWITEHKNTLSGLFYLLSIGALLRYYGAIADDSGNAIHHRGRWYLAALLAFAAALAAKSTAVTLPAAALLVLWWKNGRIRSGNVFAIIPFVLIAGASGSLTQYVETHTTGTWQADWSLSTAQKLLVAGRALWFYAGKLVWPAGLSFAYPRWQVDPDAIWQWIFPIGAVAVIALLWIGRRRLGRGPLAGVLFFCGTLMPALGFFHVLYQRYTFVADHFQYMAGIGIVAVLVGSISRIRIGETSKMILFAAVILVLAIQTWRSAHRFVSDEKVWAAALDFDPGNPLANLNIAFDLIARRNFDQAIPHLQMAMASKMLVPAVWVAMGQINEAQRNYPAATEYYHQAVDLEPLDPLPHMQFGTMLLVTGQLPAAAEQLRIAIHLDSKIAMAHDNLGVCLLHMGQIEDARDEFETARSLDPKLPLVQKHLAEAADAQRGRGVAH